MCIKLCIDLQFLFETYFYSGEYDVKGVQFRDEKKYYEICFTGM